MRKDPPQVAPDEQASRHECISVSAWMDEWDAKLWSALSVKVEKQSIYHLIVPVKLLKLQPS